MEKLPRKLLVGLSFTDDPLDPDFGLVERDNRLMDQAIWYAQKVGGSLRLVHVIEGNDYALPGYDRSLHEIVRGRAEPILRAEAERARAAGVPASFELVVSARAWYAIAKMAHDEQDELVMVGPRRSDAPWLERLAHGSTARRLVRKCPTPVWVAHPRDRLEVERVLVPTEFQPIAHQLTDIADAFHRELGVERFILHCATYPGLIAAHRHPDPAAAEEAYKMGVLEKISEKFDELLGHDERERWHTLISDDSVDDAIVTVTAAEKIDLIIMGTIGRAGLAGLIMGNTAERVLAHVTTPVWVVKPNGWESPFS